MFATLAASAEIVPPTAAHLRMGVWLIAAAWVAVVLVLCVGCSRRSRREATTPLRETGARRATAPENVTAMTGGRTAGVRLALKSAKRPRGVFAFPSGGRPQALRLVRPES